MSQHQKILDEVTVLLKEARTYLDIKNSSVETIDDKEFKGYLKHNEMVLALDEIEAISDSFEVPKEFWQCLLRAANRMNLKEHSKRYVKVVSYF
ncbi:MAG: hypothetical protein KZQ82_15400 [Candidatus Thiodiazotropha sp. (ex Lucinoma annulata)]|nr:hypothetical protein [Candidatus Thiodiazotropha sp. (ex Lucinoma annulata)]